MGLTLYIGQSTADPQQVVERAGQFMTVERVIHGGHFDVKWIKSQQESCLIYDHQGFGWVASGQALRADWSKLARRVVKAGRKSEGLLRALKLTPSSSVIDATAGLGVDSLIMASAGAQVTMIERQPALALMLSDQIQQIEQQINWRMIAPKLSLIHGEAVNALGERADQSVDLVYLDPMFESGSYRSKVSGQMQLLHGLCNPPKVAEQHALLKAAIRVGSKVVVKRAANAPHLAGQVPQAMSVGDSVRYDIYTLTGGK